MVWVKIGANNFISSVVILNAQKVEIRKKKYCDLF